MRKNYIDISELDYITNTKKKLIIDVRSEAEFLIDHIPGAINLPVLNNTEIYLISKNHPLNRTQKLYTDRTQKMSVIFIPNFLQYLPTIITVLISLILMVRFNPFSKYTDFTKFDKRIIFDAASFILISVILSNGYLIYITEFGDKFL